MLDVQYTEIGLKELNYVVVSGKVRKGGDPEIKGLFLGIKPIEQEEANLPTDLFLWIYNSNTVYILNLEHYIISSIEVCVYEYAKKSQTINFKDSEQCTAAAKLHVIQNILTKQKRIRTDGLIEVSSYKSLPEYLAKMALKEDDSTKTSLLHSRKKTIYEPNSSNRVGYVGVASNYYADQKQVATTVFKRTSRYSAEEAIIHMKAKIEEIRSGAYKTVKLKKIPADSIKKEKNKDKDKTKTESDAAGNISDEEDEYRGMYGGM
jgi:hypothetical protein